MKGIYTSRFYILRFWYVVISTQVHDPTKVLVTKELSRSEKTMKKRIIILKKNRLSPNEEKFYPPELMWYQSTMGWVNVSFTLSLISQISEHFLNGSTRMTKQTSFSYCPLGLVGRAHCLYLKLWIIKIWIKRAL